MAFKIVQMHVDVRKGTTLPLPPLISIAQVDQLDRNYLFPSLDSDRD